MTSNGNHQQTLEYRDAVAIPRDAEQSLPHNAEAEQAVLGAILIDNAVLDEIGSRLQPADFYANKHANIYEAMLRLWSKRKPIDYVTAVEALAELRLEHAAAKHPPREWVDVGLDYLAELAERVPTSANALFYAAQVRHRAGLRDAIRVTAELHREAFEHVGDLGEFFDRVETAIQAVTQRDTGKRQVQTPRSALRELMTDLDRAADKSGQVTGVASGMFELDELMAGFQPEELVILGARPSQGKTTCALSMLRRIAVHDGIAAAFFSLEMRTKQCMANMLCAEASINSKRLRSGYLDEYEYDRLVQAANRLADAPIYFDDTPGIGLREVLAKSRKLRERHGIQIVFVDYLQLMSRPTGLSKSANREQEIATLSRGLKELARELGIPVVVLAQLNRDVEKRTGSHRPRMSDLRESGAIEQDADVILLLHREHYYTRNEEDRESAELIVAKQRNGPTGTAHLRFRAEFMRFDNPEDDHAPPPREPAKFRESRPAGANGFGHNAAVDAARTGERDYDDESPFDYDDPTAPPLT